MTDKRITQLPDAIALDGTESLPLVQDGQNVRATLQNVVDLVMKDAGFGTAAFAHTTQFDPAGTAAGLHTGLHGTENPLASNRYFRIGELLNPTTRIGERGSGTAEALHLKAGEFFFVTGDRDTIYRCIFAGDYHDAIVEEIVLTKPTDPI